MYMADGHPSAKCSNVLCEANANNADQGIHVCGSQWQGVFAVFARLAATLLGSAIANTSYDCDIR